MGRPKRLPQQQTHQLATVGPPTRGLNTTGDFASMDPTDAVELDNLIATELGLTVRGGWREYATKLSGGDTVKTIMAYNSAPVSSQTPPLVASTLFAVTDKGIWNIEGGGDMSAKPAAIALSGATDAGQMSFVQFTAGGGKQYLIACSETDGAFYYDGLTWKKYTFTTGSTAPGQVAGVDPALFAQVVVWKYHLGFVRRGSAQVWWMPVNQFSGIAEGFDFGPSLRNGGMVLAAINWTMDAGDGIDDRLVILGSSGDLAVYEGTDPTDPSTFSQVGVWFIGQPPVGRRCFTSSGGNIYILTQFGVVPVAQLMSGGLDTIVLADTDLLKQLRKIQEALNVDFRTLLNTPGWALMEIPQLAMLHIARPSVSVSENIQYVFQQHALAWSRIVDMPGYCFGRRLGELYSGTTDGRVLRVFTGYSDGQKLNGTGDYEIRSRVTPAFSYFDNPTVRKRALMLRLQFLAKANPTYSVRMNADFSLSPIGGVTVGRGSVGSLWDVGKWDQAVWAGGRVSSAEWRTVRGMGFSLSPTIFLSTTQSTTLAALEYMNASGGPL
jgi:hypothetical protein